MLTQARLQERLEYFPLTGEFRWLQTRGKQVAGKRAGSGYWYRYIYIDGRFYLEHRLAFLYMTGEWPPADVDHKNNNKTDNRWDNIRLATRSENRMNTAVRRDNTSTVPGVSFYRRTQQWRAYVNRDGSQHHLGLFSSKEDAIAARQLAAERVYGEFAFRGGL